VEGDQVVIRHAYVERRIVPLDVYIDQAGPAAARDAIVDYGKAIKDLAASNIFPGDMLLKNFGVTRHGRVVFYDYDELCLLTDCNFRRMPPSRDYDDDLAEAPWFSVGENDIFPEEFPSFWGLQGELKETFDAHHDDLFGAEYWQGIQDRLEGGEVIHILPYRQDRRLRD
jgi:isocitrate dehydrogenase kinase/phosphatase